MNNFLQIILFVGFLMLVLRVEKFRQFLDFRIIKWGVIPLILLVFWGYTSVGEIFRIEQSYTTLSDEYSHSKLVYFKEGEILQGDKIKGVFKAKENNLGTVAVRFKTFYRDNDDFLIFRIKEMSDSDWYYSYQYKVDQFQPDGLFTFGFPIVADSKDKTYLFELESTRGIVGNSVGISAFSPVFTAKYKYERGTVLANYESIVWFLWKKGVNVIQKNQFLIASFTYLVPFLFYILYQKSKDQILNPKRKPNVIYLLVKRFLFSKPFKLMIRKSEVKGGHAVFANWLLGLIEHNLRWLILLDVYGLILLFILQVAIIGSIFLTIPQTSTTFALTILWAILVYLYRIPWTVSFAIGFGMFILTPFLDLTDFKLFAENIMGWGFTLLNIGVIQLTIQFHKIAVEK